MLGLIQNFAKRFIEEKGKDGYNPMTADFAPNTKTAIKVLSDAPLSPTLRELVGLSMASGAFQAQADQSNFANQELNRILQSTKGLMRAQQQRTKMSADLAKEMSKFGATQETTIANATAYVQSWEQQIAAEANSLG